MLTMERNVLTILINILQILNLIDLEVRIKVRKLEKLNTKRIQIKCAITFEILNDICTKAWLFPSYTFID